MCADYDRLGSSRRQFGKVKVDKGQNASFPYIRPHAIERLTAAEDAMEEEAEMRSQLPPALLNSSAAPGAED